MSKVFHFDWQLTNENAKLFGENGTLTLYKNSGEGMPHIAMKLLSYFWFYHPELAVERHANQNWKPDLVRFNRRGQPVQWIDCGSTKKHKLDRISTRNKLAYIDIVKKNPSELQNYKNGVERSLRYPHRVRYFAPTDSFMKSLCSKISGRHNIVATITGQLDYMYLDIDREMLETSITKYTSYNKK